VDEACAIAREKVHRAAAALEWLVRLHPELAQSEPAAAGLGVPRPPEAIDLMQEMAARPTTS